MRRPVAFTLGILFVVAGFACEKKAENWFDEGIQALEEDRFESAMACFKKTIELNPEITLQELYEDEHRLNRDLNKRGRTRSGTPIDLPAFEKSASRLLEKTALLKEKALLFNDEKILKQLEKNTNFGYAFRFDENIDKLVCKEKSDVHRMDENVLPAHHFEFNGKDAVNFRTQKGTCVMDGGVLRLLYAPGDYLVNDHTLNIVKDNVGEIEIRIKLKKGRSIHLGWSKNESVALSPEDIGSIKIDTIPDNQFHTYRINAKTVLKKALDYGDVIKRVYLAPSDTEKDEVEIDFIRFVSKRAKYTKKRFGEAYETLAKETRKVLYANSPMVLNCTVDLPHEKPVLRFGTGVLEENNPITFKVSVKYDDAREEIYTGINKRADVWEDVNIDLSPWSGKSVELYLETNSATRNVAFWSNPIIYTAPEKKSHVIIVLEDSLRADHLSCYGHTRETTPIKDQWVKRGVLFVNAFSQATKTRPSCPSLMTSLYPTATGVWKFTEMLDDRYLTMAEILRSQGFATASFVQNGNAGPYAGLHQGFCRILDAATIGHRAEEIYGKRLFDWLAGNRDRNLFLYLHLTDPHGRYDPPKPFDSWYREEPPGKTMVTKSDTLDPKWVSRPTLEGRRRLYDGEVRYNDRFLKDFLDKLEAFNISDDAAIVFISDHGEHLGEHGLWAHRPPGYIQVLHVPLLMVWPNRLPEGVRIKQPVQLIDIMPTMLELLGIDQKELLLQGDSLVSLMEGNRLAFWDNRLCISEEVVNKSKESQAVDASIFYKEWHILDTGALKDDTYLKISDKNIHTTFFSTRLFNYKKDKNEDHSVDFVLSDMVFKYKVKKYLSELKRCNMEIWRTLTGMADKTIEYDPDVMERLRNLGYMR